MALRVLNNYYPGLRDGGIQTESQGSGTKSHERTDT